MKDMFAYSIFPYFGYSIGSSIMNCVLFVLGFKYSLYATGFLIFLHCWAGVEFMNSFNIMLMIGMSGVIRQMISILTILFFTELTRDEAAKYYPKPLSGTSLGSFIWAYILSYMINPHNEDLKWKVKERGVTNSYYDWTVAQNVYSFYILHGIIGFFTFVAIGYITPEPEQYKNRFREVWHYLRNDSKSLRKSYHSFMSQMSESLNRSNSHVNAMVGAPQVHSFVENKEKENSEELELRESLVFKDINEPKSIQNFANNNEELETYEIPENKEVTQPKEKADDESDYILQYRDSNVEKSVREELLSLTFWVIFFVSIMRNSQNAFIVDNFKIQGMGILNNDNLVNQAYAISGLLALIARSFTGELWEKYGLLDCYTIAMMSSFFLDFVYLMFIEKMPNFFLFTIVFARCVMNFNNIMNYLTLYTVYSSNMALKLAVVYDLHYFVAIIVTIGCNYLLVDGLNFKPAYGFYLAFDIICLILLFTIVRPAMLKPRGV